MAISVLAAAGTFNLKQGTGRVLGLSCPSAGTNFTLQINDGPTSTGTVRTLYGATPTTLTTGIILFDPLIFTNGLQVVLAGTPGELDIDWI
jgi:hypothetical protein